MRSASLYYQKRKEQQTLHPMADDTIHISEVLADMETVAEDGKLYTFSLSFVRANKGGGGPRGSIKTVDIAAKFTRPHRRAKTSSDEPAWQFKHHDAIPIQDVRRNILITPKYTHIIEYNGKKVIHYGR
jgi:hypothetical protein